MINRDQSPLGMNPGVIFDKKRGQPSRRGLSRDEGRLVVVGADAVQQAASFDKLDEFRSVAEQVLAFSVSGKL